MIGVLLDPDLEYGLGVLEGVRDFARGQVAWNVLPLSQAQEPVLTRLVRSGEVRGLVGTFISDRWLQGRFPGFRPLVNTSNLSRVTSVCSVVPDDAAVGRAVARHFCELGVERGACIADRAMWASHARREGFLEELRAHGVAVDEPHEGEVFRHETAWQAWVCGLERETAVFCTSDALARRFYLMCKRLDAAVARNLPVLAGVGDSLTERAVAGVDLTSVPLPSREVGYRAAERLALLLEGSREIVTEPIAPGPIIVRGSSARVSGADEVVARALGIVLQATSRNLGVDEVAQRVGVSRRTLEGRFRLAFGHGPAEEIRLRRLVLARRLLVETGLRVEDVARRCGCASVQAFSTLFRRAYGCPPGEFRRRSRTGGCAGPPVFDIKNASLL